VGIDVFAVVSPAKTKDGKDGYKLQVASRKGVPPFGPLLPRPSIFEAGPYFRNFLLTKGTPNKTKNKESLLIHLKYSVLNGDRASLHSPFLATKLQKTRQHHLQNLVETFFPAN